jgi:hypothetical protein
MAGSVDVIKDYYYGEKTFRVAKNANSESEKGLTAQSGTSILSFPTPSSGDAYRMTRLSKYE